ncbi:hypothetical protein KQX54_004305 [Cotesia glomerata]|uniref:Uncharacterized protein n=1 Tax=Cotesia glomerata TaxID=32391 RepID=A0AAV7IHX8_COTGL|nr:hypothetical protein KQX54_004305 [Cotesia glomerata]
MTGLRWPVCSHAGAASGFSESRVEDKGRTGTAGAGIEVVGCPYQPKDEERASPRVRSSTSLQHCDVGVVIISSSPPLSLSFLSTYTTAY